MPETNKLISVCIITYKRPELLKQLLMSLKTQHLENDILDYEVIVVDNDKNRSAELIVKGFNRNFQTDIKYDVEPTQNISLARNKSVAMAKGDYIAFVDDDEQVCHDWLYQLYLSLKENNADASFGPVFPVLPDSCPEWIEKGNFFSKDISTDHRILNTGRTSNALIKKKWIKQYPEPFKKKYGLTGGEDSDFFRRIKNKGAVFCWADKAVVSEYIPENRLTLKWLLLRAFRSGQTYAHHSYKNKTIPEKFIHYPYRMVLFLFALIMAMFSLPFGHHKSVWWLRKTFSNLGQISIILPYTYKPYKVKTD